MKKHTHQSYTIKKHDWAVIEQEYVTSQARRF